VSIEAVTWALQQPVLDPGTKLVLVAIAHLADKHHRCFPGRKHLAAVTGQAPEKVKADLDALRDAGLLADTGERAGPSSRAVVWVLAVAGPVTDMKRWEPPF
jgi:hypothetical protein